MPTAAHIFVDEDFFEAYPLALSFVELFDHIPGVIFYAKDAQSRFIAANRAMLAAKNLDHPDCILGHTDHDFHPAAMATAYIEEDQAVMNSGKSLPNQVWFVLDQSGSPGWFNSSKVPLIDRETVIGIAGVRYAIETPEDREHLFQALAPVFSYLEEHYAQPVSMEEMAKLAGLSATHFNRRFREVIGMNPTKFLHSLRIEKARMLLAKSRTPIGQIALEVGYHDQSHFTRHFRKLTGETPKTYRQSFQSSSE
ncbi:MAG: AraC family transcriptional regulator [Verrucomicrobiota bacterium]